jgi:hypothetical protein
MTRWKPSWSRREAAIDVANVNANGGMLRNGFGSDRTIDDERS